MSIKTKRIGSDMAKVISNILLEEARDTLLKQITITAVEVTNDLSFAKVYFTSLNTTMSHQQLEKEMEEAQPFIRKLVAEKMDLRNTPKLKFLYDESIDYASHIEEVIEKIHENEN